MNKKIITFAIIIGILIVGFSIYYFVQNNESFYKCPNDGEYMTSGEYKWIDCMPPTTSKFCKSEYRNWIQKNCPGIEFTE
jgi:hypothetical protein